MANKGCSLSHEVTARFLLENERYATQVVKMSNKLNELDIVSKTVDGDKRRTIEAIKSSQEAKLEAYILARMADGKNKSIYMETLLDLYQTSGNLGEGIRLVKELQSMMDSGLTDMLGVLRHMPQKERGEAMSRLQTGILERMAHDYAYASKFGIKQFVEDFGNISKLKKSVKDVVKGKTMEDLFNTYGNKDPIFLSIMDRTEDVANGFTNYIIARAAFNGNISWQDIPRDLWTNIGGSELSRQDAAIALSRIRNKITNNGLEQLQHLFLTNLDSFMSSKSLMNMLQNKITRVVASSSNIDDIRLLNAVRELQLNITRANMDRINTKLATSVSMQRLNEYANVGTKKFNDLLKLVGRYASDPLGEPQKIGSVKVRTHSGREKTFNKDNIHELISMMGLDTLFNNGIDIENILARSIIDSRKTKAFIERAGMNEVIQAFKDGGVEGLMRSLTKYDFTEIKNYLNDVVRLHSRKKDPETLSNVAVGHYLKNVATDAFDNQTAIFWNRQLDTTAFHGDEATMAFSDLSTAELRNGALLVGEGFESYGTLDDIIQAVRSSDIHTQIVIPHNFRLSDADRKAIDGLENAAGNKVKIVHPHGERDFSFFIDGDKLYHGAVTTTNKNYINELNRQLGNSMEMIDYVDNTNLYRQILEMRFGDTAEQVARYLDDTYPTDTAFQKIKRLEYAQRVNSGIDRTVPDLNQGWTDIQGMTVEDIISDVRSRVPVGDFQLASDIDINELRKVFFNYKYSDTIEQKGRALNDILIMVGRDGNVSPDEHHAIAMIENLIAKGYEIPFLPIESVVKLFNGKQPRNVDAFFNAFNAKNQMRLSDVDTMDETIDVLRRSYDETLYHHSYGDFEWSVNLNDRLVYENLDMSELNALRQDIARSVPDSGDLGSIAINVDIETRRVRDIIDRYYSEAERMIREGASEKEMYDLKRRYQSLVYVFEQEYVVPRFGGYVSNERQLYTDVFDVIKVTDVEQLPVLRQQLDGIIDRYRSQVDEVISIQDKVRNNELTWADRYTQLTNKGYYLAAEGDKIIKQDIDSLLYKELSNMPDSIGDLARLKDVDWTKVTNAQKTQWFRVIKEVNKARNRGVSPADAIYEKLFGLNEGQLMNYSVVKVSQGDVGELPYILTQTNRTGLSSAEDKLLKYRIFQAIGKNFSDGKGLDETTLSTIISNVLGKENVEYLDAYMRDFSFYTKIRRIPDSLQMRFKEVNRVAQDVEEVIKIAGDMQVNTLRGPMSVRELFSAGPDDVVSKTLPSSTPPSAIPYSQSEDIARKGRNLFYRYESQMDAMPDIYQDIKTTVFNTAQSILRASDSARLNKMADVGNQLSMKAQAAARILNVSFGFWGARRKYLTRQNLPKVQEIYDNIVNLPQKRFDELIDSTKNDENFKMAYVIADYFRSLRDGLKNITTDDEINGLIDRLPELFSSQRFRPDQMKALGTQIRAYEILEMIDQVGDPNLARRQGAEGGTRRFRTYETSDGGLFSKTYFGRGGFMDEKGLETFNRLFDSNVSMQDYKYILTAYNRMRLGDVVSRATQFINKLVRWSNHPFTRSIISFPGSFMMIGSSILTYASMREGYKKMLGETSEGIRRARQVRQELGVLVGEGSDVTELRAPNYATTTPSLTDIYKSYQLNYGEVMNRIIAPALDNFHNGVDAANAGAIKDMAFISALRTNKGPMRFNNADDFARWLDTTTDARLKRDVVDSVTAQAYEIFRADVGMHPTTAEAPQFAGVRGIMIPTLNFRGAWGLMMFRDLIEITSQTYQLGRYFYRHGRTPESIAQAERWLANNPKFTRFYDTMFTSGYWAIKLEKALHGQDPIEEREEDYVKNIINIFTNMTMRGAGLSSNAYTRVLGLHPGNLFDGTQGLLGGAIYGYRNAEDFGVNKVQGTFKGGMMGMMQQMQNSFFAQLRFLEPGRRLMTSYTNGGWDAFVTELDFIRENLSTGMARYALEDMNANRLNDYVPVERSPNYTILGLNSTPGQELRNELFLREKLAKYFFGIDNQRVDFLEKGEPGYMRENMKNSFFWSELANTGPVGRMVDAILGNRFWTYNAAQGPLLEEIYQKDPFIRSFIFDNKLDIDLIDPEHVDRSIDTIWHRTANFAVGRSNTNVTPADIIKSFLGDKQANPDLYLMQNDNVALDAIPAANLSEIQRLDMGAMTDEEKNEAWRMFINELNNLPEDKKPFASGLFMKIYMNREYARRVEEFKEAVKNINKGRPRSQRLSTALTAQQDLAFKYEIIKEVQDRFVQVDRPAAQAIVNDIMAINHTQELKELGIIDTVNYNNGDIVFRFAEGWDNYMGDVARLTSMIVSGEPDAYKKTQSYFNNIGKYSGPAVQLAMLHRIWQFIDDREIYIEDKLSWKAGILEANRKLLFTETDALREQVGDDIVDAAIRYYYQFDDELRDYALDVYNKEKLEGNDGTGGRNVRLPNFQAWMLGERPRGDARVAKGVPLNSYHKHPVQLARENPSPPGVEDLPDSAISKPLFTTSEKVKDITRRIARMPVERFRFRENK